MWEKSRKKWLRRVQPYKGKYDKRTKRGRLGRSYIVCDSSDSTDWIGRRGVVEGTNEDNFSDPYNYMVKESETTMFLVVYWNKTDYSIFSFEWSTIKTLLENGLIIILCLYRGDASVTTSLPESTDSKMVKFRLISRLFWFVLGMVPDLVRLRRYLLNLDLYEFPVVFYNNIYETSISLRYWSCKCIFKLDLTLLTLLKYLITFTLWHIILSLSKNYRKFSGSPGPH